VQNAIADMAILPKDLLGPGNFPGLFFCFFKRAWRARYAF
jgi:hypothetical protein